MLQSNASFFTCCLCFLLLVFFFFLTLTRPQICALPPGTISDMTNEHNLTVHWTEKHTHRDCALYTGDTSIHHPSFTHDLSLMDVSSSFFTLWTFDSQKVGPRAGVGTLLRIRNFSGIVCVCVCVTVAGHCGDSVRSADSVCCVFLRSELSVEKTSVLQSELQSCNQLQELEPLNKCKCL